MKIAKAVVFAVAILALLPFAGFWIVAVLAAVGMLVAFGAVVLSFFPLEQWFRDNVINFSGL